jgi:hypothetical protein
MDSLLDAVGFPRRPRFFLGSLYITPGAWRALAEARQGLGELLGLHQAGDWGCVDQDQMVRNHKAVEVGNDVISAYILPNTGTKIWIVTTDIRWFTGVFLASETC